MVSKPLKFDLDGQGLTFATLDDFAFSLAGRIQVPAGTVTHLMHLDPVELRREATGIRDLERRFVDLLADALRDPSALARHLREIDKNVFAEDNRWRAILGALVEQGDGYDEYQRVALVKYMQYLAARRDIVKGIYAQKFAGQDPLLAQEPGNNGAMKETLILEEESDDHTEPVPVRFQRLPRGETVHLSLAETGELPIVLSRHKFVLFTRERMRLTDDNGVNYPLKSGINVIGRHPDNDVVVGGWYRDVSRKHLMVNITDTLSLSLTDLSTHGTFVPGSLLSAPSQ
jgi:hypothetical protein